MAPAAQVQAIALACLACLLGAASAYDRPARFLLISSPSTRSILYSVLPDFHDLTLPRAERPVPHASVLIDGNIGPCKGWVCPFFGNEGLKEPTSMALWQRGGGRGTLYVSDQGAGKIFAYDLTTSWRGFSLEAGPQRTVLANLTEDGGATGLAVDSMGNLFFTMGKAGRVRVVDARSLKSKTPVAKTMYSAKSLSAVAMPTGIAADNFNVFWANKQGTAQLGTVVQAASASRSQPRTVATKSDVYKALATNLCLARDNIFFTGESSSLFAVKSSGGDVATISSNFTEPRGCAYDDESSLYVADSGQDAVLSLPANLGTLRPVKYLAQVAIAPKPSHVAVFSGPSSMASLRQLSTSAAGRTSSRQGFLLFLAALLAAVVAL